MLTDADVLSALSERLSPGEISTLLARLLRVPTAWRALHNPTLLDRALASSQESQLAPSRVALASLGLQQAPGSEKMAPDIEARLEKAWSAAQTSASPPVDIETTALLAIGLIRLIADEGPAQVASLLLSAPRAWESPLACAWPDLPQSTLLIRELTRNARQDGVRLAAHALLANMAPDVAAPLLRSASPDLARGQALAALCAGEQQLAVLLAGEDNGSSRKNAPEDGRTTDLLHSATGTRLRGDIPQARETLERAWIAAARTSAEVADEMAELAALETDPVLALEARLQALRSDPTPLRKANVAVALVDLGRSAEALGVLPADGRSFEELIAAGLAEKSLGKDTALHSSLLRAFERFPTSPDANPAWLARLLDGLHGAGWTVHAIEVAERLVNQHPTDAQARTRLATLLRGADEFAQGATQASLALALSPNLVSARRVLAECLQSDGRPLEAMPYWQILAASSGEHLPDLAYCALEAGDIGTANQAGSQLLANDPTSAVGHLITARAMAASGDQAQALELLARMTRTSPQNADLWIALAEMKGEAEGADSARITLELAAQYAPDSPNVHAAQARAYRRAGRLQDALHAIEKAVRLEPGEGRWLADQGALLKALGHADRALPVLERAFARKPGNMLVRFALAETHEHLGDLQAASRVLPDAPDSAPPEIQLAAARFAIRLASITGDTSRLGRAQRLLDLAKTAAPGQPSPHFWMAQWHEKNGQPRAALAEYHEAASLAAETEPDLHRQSLIGASRCALDQGDTGFAVQTLEQVRQRYPSSIQALIALAHAYHAAGSSEEALHTAREALDLNPTEPEHLRALAQASAAVGDWPTAMRGLARLNQLHPEDPAALVEWAQAARQSGDTAQARDLLARALVAWRNEPRLLMAVAAHLKEAGALPAAHLVVRRAARLAPDSPDVLRELAGLSSRLRQARTAADAWTRLAGLCPDNPEIVGEAAKALWDLDERPAAIGLWQTTAAAQPNLPDPQVNLARAYLATDQPQQCLAHYARALRLVPENVDLALEAGTAAIACGADQVALHTLRHASELDPQRLDVRTAFAEALFRHGRYSECKEILQNLSPAEPIPAKFLAFRALASVETGDLPSAQSAFEQAMSQGAETPEDAALLSRAALRLARWHQAVDILTRQAARSGQKHLPTLLLQLVEARLWTCEDAALYAMAEVTRHAPVLDPESDGVGRDLEALLHQAARKGAPAAEVQRLRTRVHTFFGGDGAEADHSTASDTAWARETSALAALRRGHPAQAVALLTEPSASPISARQRLLRGLAHLATGEPGPAITHFEGAASDPVLRPVAEYMRGIAYLAGGSRDRALEAMNTALAVWPDEPAWHYRLASLYLEDDNLGAALPHFQHAAELEPEHTGYVLSLARAFQSDGQLSEALNCFTRVLTLHPDQASIWKEAGKLALAFGQAQDAESWFEQAHRMDPTDPHTLVGAGQAAAMLGKPRQALDHLRAASRLAPDDPQVLLGMGEILAKQGKLEKALQTYDRALALVGDPSPVQLARSRLLIGMGRLADASDILRALVEKHPDSDSLWLAFAEAKDAADDIEGAMEAATRALRIAPRSSVAHRALARLCRRAGQLDRALDELAQAQALDPTDAGVYIERGRVHEDRREPDRALESYEHAVAVRPTSAEAYYRMGLIHKSMKSYAQAAGIFRKAVELNPADADAYHQLAAVHALELVHGGLRPLAVAP